MSARRFAVATKVVALAVTVENGAVVGIELNAHAPRRPNTPLERRVAKELREYAIGNRTDFTFPITLQGTPFERKVWKAVSAIPYGDTATYGEIARRVGKPDGARAVGAANGRNPLPLVVPCHRVVAAGGKLGGYGGGVPLKRRLLALEQSREP